MAATVAGHDITIAELKASLEEEPLEAKPNFEGKDGLKKYLSYYLFSKLLYEQAMDDGMMDADAAKAVDKFKERYLSQKFYEKNFLSKIELTEKEAREYYDKHPDEFKDSGKLPPFESVKAQAKLLAKRDRALAMNDLWLKGQYDKRGIKINEQAFPSSK